MKFTTLTAAIAIAIAAQTAAANAAIIQGDFIAIVGGDSATTIQQTAGATTPDTGYMDGESLGVSFRYDNVAHTYSRFQIGSYALAPSVTLTQGAIENPGNQTIIFSANQNANETFSLTLAAAGKFTAPVYPNPLTVPAASQIDFTNSIASILIDNADGSQTVLQAVLSAVPEPASMAVLLTGIAGLAARRRRA